MNILQPKYYIKHVTNIDPNRLKALGYTTVFLDRDNTLVSREETEAQQEVNEWILQLKAHGLQVMLVSNSFSDKIEKEALALGVDYIDRALKPLPCGMYTAMKRLDVDAGECVMVGDQIFTDVVAANIAGVSSILVEPLTEVDLWHTVQLRKVEKLVLSGRVAKAGL